MDVGPLVTSASDNFTNATDINIKRNPFLVKREISLLYFSYSKQESQMRRDLYKFQKPEKVPPFIEIIVSVP